MLAALIFLVLAGPLSPTGGSAKALHPAARSMPAVSAAATETYTLLVSTSPGRTSPEPLAGRTVSGSVYVFTSPDTGVARVRFYLDDPRMAGSPRRTESGAPYDFAGGTVGTASPFDTTRIPDGGHTITAAVELSAGGAEVVHATFTVANAAPGLTFSPAALSLPAPGGGRAAEDITLGTTDGTVTAYTVSDDAVWLTAGAASGSTPATLTLTADTTGLAPGIYTAMVRAAADGYKAAALEVSLTVGDQVHLAWVGDPSTTMTVVWRTFDTTTPSIVEYRPRGATAWQTATGARRPSGATGTLHEVTLTALAPATTYEYRVRREGAT